MHDLTQLGTAFAEALAADLTGLIGRVVEIGAPELADGKREAVTPKRGPLIITQAATHDADARPLFVVASQKSALAISAMKQGLAAVDAQAAQSAPFEGDHLNAYTEILDLLVGILGRVFAEEASLPGLKRGDTSSNELPLPEAGVLPKGAYRRARFPIRIEGFPGESFDVLFPRDLAADWFGASQGGGEIDESLGPLVVFDPSPDSRDQLDELSDTIGVAVWCIDPSDVGPHTFDEIADGRAILLCWDLGRCSGLDLVERLRRDERTAGMKIAMAFASPTRHTARAALRWGVDSLLSLPWDAEEIRERVLDGARPAAASDSTAEASADASNPSEAASGEEVAPDDANASSDEAAAESESEAEESAA